MQSKQDNKTSECGKTSNLPVTLQFLHYALVSATGVDYHLAFSPVFCERQQYQKKTGHDTISHHALYAVKLK
jgi:hypothetical protein